MNPQKPASSLRRLGMPALMCGSVMLAPTGTPADWCSAGDTGWVCSQGDTGPGESRPPAANPATSTPATPPAVAQASPAAPEPVAAPSTVAVETERGTGVHPGAPQAAVHDLDAGIDWSQCAATRTVYEAPLSGNVPAGLAEGALFAEADALVGEFPGDRTQLLGSVYLTDALQELFAEDVTIDRAANRVTASGGVLMQRPDARISGASASLDRDTNRIEVTDVDYRIPSAHGRGSAAEAVFLDGRQSRYKDILFTTCRPGNTDWALYAKTLEVDHTEGLATADRARLEFKNVPIAYLPTFTFPIDDRRRSGFLLPSGGYSSRNGLDLSVPYYFNLAPNYDATFAPRFLSKRGLALGGEARLLTRHYRSTLAGELIAHDRDFEDGAMRGAGALRTDAAWAPGLTGTLRLNYASDSAYFEDYGNDLATSSIRQLERLGQVRLAREDWALTGRLQYFQTIDKAIAEQDRPYARLPQVLFEYQRAGAGGLVYELDSEYVYFDRNDSTVGHRVDVMPGVRLPLRRIWGFVEPAVAARYTAYRLDEEQRAGLTDASPDRLLGIFSVDAGLYFDRETRWFDTALRQSLEPRLYYLYVPEVEQDDLPVFDTTELDFNVSSLFRNNRFNGPDRHGDANQLTWYLGSRTLTKDGAREFFRFGVGQVLYFADREVTLPGGSAEDESSSSYVGDIGLQPSPALRFRAAAQWNPHDRRVEQSLARVEYRPDEDRVLNLSYRSRDDENELNDIEQTDVAFAWPVGDRTRLVGRWNYSLLENRTLESVFGIEYGQCCWRVRGIIQQYADDEDDEQNLAVLLQLELYGLGRIGNDIDDFLERRVVGYDR